MDPEATIATLWMLVGVGGPVALIYSSALLFGLEVESTFELVLSLGVISVSMAWMIYCTWRIRLVSMGRNPGLKTPAPEPEE